MFYSILICALTCLGMILAVLFLPSVKVGRIHLSGYWLVVLLGACVMLLVGQADINAVGKALIADTAVNPLKILALFLSMTVLSVFLDELGFFRYFANFVLSRARRGQRTLFFALYAIVSVLTVFTSNDVIILSFTPFICYFCKHAGIDPLPYLAAEFVAANTWSMALVIGNPTNIYLSSALGIDFVEYLEVSILPTFLAGGVALACLYLLFHRKLKLPIHGEAEACHIEDKPLLVVGVLHLALCTVLLAVGSYFGFPMWLISVSAVASLFLVTLIFSLFRRRPPKPLWGCVKRAPYTLIPFVLGMFVLIVGLDEHGVTQALANLLGTKAPIFAYGTASFLAANLVNNIPMSVLFSSVISAADPAVLTPAAFAAVIGSNLGALFTPVGALAGIMWSGILHRHGVKFGYLDFLKIGVFIALPALTAALLGLWLVL